MRTYWRFYWPLALTGVAMVLAVQFQNGALARYPNAVTELAVFALASSTFGFLNAGLNFAPQLSNVFARSPHGKRLSHQFIAVWSLILTIPLALIAGTPGGAAGVALAYGIDAALTERVIEYLLYMLPLLFITAQRMFYTGLLVQAQLTGWVTTLNAVFLAAAVIALVVGFALGLEPVVTIVGAQTIAGLLHWALTALVYRLQYRWPVTLEHETLTVAELLCFFLPMTATGVMFAISRPVLYAFVSRMPEGIASIAALRVAFDFSTMFQQAANQFRHFFVTFGLDDIRTKRRFMALVGAGLTAIMVGIALTPVAQWILGGLLGIRGRVLDHATEVLLVMCLMPVVIIARNYFHGTLMVKRRTGGMAIGGVMRVLAIAVLAQAAFAAGWLDHVVAAFILLLGFVAETVVVLVGHTRLTRRAVGQEGTTP